MKGSRMGVETGGWTEGDRDSQSLESAVLASRSPLLVGACFCFSSLPLQDWEQKRLLTLQSRPSLE